MGTNYYLHAPKCAHCGKPEQERLHIGRSSAGWCFMLHIIPEREIHELPDWRPLWNRPGWEIRNEYGDLITEEQMLLTILARGPAPHPGDSWYKSQDAIRGPFNLSRVPAGGNCRGAGQGTYDLVEGDFS